MISLKLCRYTLISLFAVLVIISALRLPAYCQEAEDSQVFISGFNAYQNKDYPTTITRMNEVLQKYPGTALRDMVLFWLSRAYFKNGNLQDAARTMSRFSKEYPDSPLKGTVDEELLALTARYDRGEQLPAASASPAVVEPQPAERKAVFTPLPVAQKAAEQAQPVAATAEDARSAAAAEATRLATRQQEQERQAAVKAEDERAAAEKLKAEQDLQEKREHDQLVRQQDELMRQALDKAEKKRLAVLKAEQERTAVVAAEASILLAQKAEEERKAAEKAEQLRIEQEKVEQARAAAEDERKKQALKKQEQERLAAELVQKEKQAAAAAVAAALEATKPIQAKTEVQRPATVRKPADKASAAKAVLREKAIAQYKSILVAYPTTKAAATAAAKLKELGVSVSQPVQVVQPVAAEPVSETAQVFRLEVAQFAGLEFNLSPPPQSCTVAQRVSLPLEITNQGNGSDSFYLESGFPAEFSAGFSSVAAPDVEINQTGALAPGETFKGLLHFTVPASSIDGRRISHPVKASSRIMAEATQSREVKVTAAAPLLRATVKVDRTNPLPGERIVYRVAVLNVGSTGAEDVSFRLNFPPQLEPVDYAATGFRQEMKAALVIDGLRIKSGESREFALTFQLRDDALAGQELLTRAELQNTLLKSTSVYISSAAYVQPQHGLRVSPGSERLVILPGQTVSVPFVVTNTGNVREKFSVVSAGTAGQLTTIFQDLNRDGVRQANEPVITEVGPLAAKEEASIVIEIQTPRAAADGSEESARIAFRTEGDASRTYDAATRLVYSRPLLQMAMSGRDGRLKPGEVASLDLIVTNRGSNLARIVELKSVLPEQIELVAADPLVNSVSNGTLFWKFRELGAGERRVIKVSFRVKAGIGMGTNIQVRNTLTYEDQIGNRY